MNKLIMYLMTTPKGLYIPEKDLIMYQQEDLNYLMEKGYINKEGKGYKRMLVIPLDIKI